MNICKNCKHLYKIGAGDGERWYEYLCKKLPRTPTTDPLTGKKGFLATNDLGTTYVTDVPFGFCRDLNRDCNCPQFVNSQGFLN